MFKLTNKAAEALKGQTIVRVEKNALHLSSGKAIYLDEEEVESLNEFYDSEQTGQPFTIRKNNDADPVGTSYHDVTITATVNQLRKVFGEPTYNENLGNDKVNIEWDLEDSELNVVTLYDWKEYRVIEEDEQIEWHIGSMNQAIALNAANAINELLKKG